MEPKSVPGRALVMIEKEIYEYQNYFPFSGTREIDRVQEIKKYIKSTLSKYELEAKPIPEIPDVATVDYISEHFGDAPNYHLIAGINYDTVDTVILDLTALGYLATSGREKSGKTNFIKYLTNVLSANVDKQSEFFVFDGFDHHVSFLRDMPHTKHYSTEVEEFEKVIDLLIDEALSRREKVKQDGFDGLADVPMVVTIIQDPNIFEPKVVSAKASESFKKLLKLAKDVKMLVLASSIDNSSIGYGGSDILKCFKEPKSLLFFDDLAACKVFDIPMNDLRVNKRKITLGDAFYITDREVTRLKTPKL